MFGRNKSSKQTKNCSSTRNCSGKTNSNVEAGSDMNKCCPKKQTRTKSTKPKTSK